MALSRRNFVRTVGIGTAGALTTSFIGARGRENAIWSALDPAVHSMIISVAPSSNP